jgi:long-chain fatty acid transport protein
VNGSLAATVAPGLSVGAGIEYQKLEATLTNAVNYTAVIAQASQLVLGTPAIVPGAEGHVRLHGDDRGWAYVASAQWRITPRLLVGLSYRSGISYDVRGDASFDVPALPSPGLAALAAAATPSGPVSVAIKTPDMRGIGGSYTLPNGARLFVQGVRTGWSSVQEQRVVRDNGQVLSLTPLAWKDAWRYGVGMAWPLASGTVLRAGIARDETPIPAETRNTRLPANTWTTAGLGARFLLRQDHERHEADRPGCIDCIDVALGYTWVQNAPVREGGETPPGSGVLPSGLVAGDYRGRSTLAGVQYTHRF